MGRRLGPPIPDGTTCGELVVIDGELRRGTDPGYKGVVLCFCNACGRAAIMLAYRVRNEYIKTCGCGMVGGIHVGDVFGKITVIGVCRVFEDRPGWLIRCSCGREEAWLTEKIKKAKFLCCSSCRPASWDWLHEGTIESRKQDRLKVFRKGTKIGRLTIIKPVDHAAKYFLCSCSCGTKSYKLNAGRRPMAQSCGCLRSEKGQGSLTYTIFGEELTRVDIAEAFDVSIATFAKRLKQGMTPEEAICRTPLQIALAKNRELESTGSRWCGSCEKPRLKNKFNAKGGCCHYCRKDKRQSAR